MLSATTNRTRTRTRLARLAPARPDLLLLALLIALATTVYAIYALRVGSFQNDEEQYLQLARYVAKGFPHVLWQSGIYPRGTQRLDPVILAIGFALARGPGAYELDHVIQCLLFASTALPVFLLARQASLPAGACLFAATLSIVIPWAVVSTSFLAESAAYPAYAWVLFATMWLLRRPSRGRELFVLVTLALAALSRAALLAMAPLPALAIVWHEWSWRLRTTPRLARARELPRRVWCRYRILTIAVALALLVYVANELGLLAGRGLASLAGEYGLPRLEGISSVLARYREYLSRMTAGTGYIAVAIGLPWVVAVLAGARDGARHALAVVCVLGVAVIMLSLLKGGPDERYVLYGAVPISLAAAAGLADMGKPAVRPSLAMAAGVLAGALAVVLLIDSVTWPALSSPYDFFSYPARTFYTRVVLGHVGTSKPLFLHIASDRLVELAILLIAGAWVASWRRPALRRPAAVTLAVGLLLFCGAETFYALRKFTDSAGEAYGAAATQRSWVDEHVPGGARVGRLGISEGELPDYFAIWRVTTFWNTSVNQDVYTDNADPLPVFLGDRELHLSIDGTSGLMTFREAGVRPLPSRVLRYLLVPRAGTNRMAVAGRVVAQDPYLPLTLMETSQPARLDWLLTGTTGEAFAASGIPVTATIFPDALRGQAPLCATFALIGAPHFVGQWHFTVSLAGRMLKRGSLRSQETLTLTVPLPSSHGRALSLSAVVHGDALYAGQLLSARFANFDVIRCPAAR